MRRAANDDGWSVGTVLSRPLKGLAGLLYRHMGVYVGDGRVIHFNEDGTADPEHAVIVETDVERFALGMTVRAHATPKNAAHGLAVATEARRLLNAPSEWNGNYHVVAKNCETFCLHCYQVEYF